MSTVHFSGIKKTYPNGVNAVQGVDLAIEDGEFVVIVGPSGCGKSTLLRMVAGLEVISEGELQIDERRVNDLEPKDRDIAMVFQNYALYPHMTVRQNMAYGLKNRGEPRAVIAEKVESAAQTLGLDQLLDRKPSQLSGGQRQRVAMGRAIVREPKVFLFDEPLSNLDAKLRVQMRVEIKRLQRALGVTSIFVTHDQVEAMTLADRLVAMNDGRVEQIGPPMALYQRPESLFVAGFIGSPPMNLLPAATAGQLAADMPARTRTLGFRPEDAALVDRGGDLAGRVQFTEQLGAESLIHVVVNDAESVIVRAESDRTVEPDTAIHLSIAREGLHPFDDEGRRIAYS
ncbi:MAG: sn-glycerol-3-phosphate ABC transporter ATP-binding protein UgpC [Pseudomonadota bacterium]